MALVKQPRSPFWQVRRCVPEHIQQIVGRKEIWKSTGTADRKTAERIARRIEVEVDRLLEDAETIHEARDDHAPRKVLCSVPLSLKIGEHRRQEREKHVTIRQLVDRWDADPGRSYVTARSKANYKTPVAVLEETLGADTLVKDVTRANARTVQEALIDRGMTTTTTNGALSCLSAIWRFAVREEWAQRNVFEGMRLKAKVADRDLRRAYTPEELRRILGSELPPSLHWMARLSAFMGLRLSEAAALEKGDLVLVDDIWCLQVRGTKTEAAFRTIPVHPELEGAFRDFCEPLEGRLFPDIVLSDGGRAAAASKAWGRFMEKIGADYPKTSFHSLRHSASQAAKEGGVHPSAMDAIFGWSGGSQMSARYGGAWSMVALKAEIGKVRPLGA